MRINSNADLKAMIKANTGASAELPEMKWLKLGNNPPPAGFDLVVMLRSGIPMLGRNIDGRFCQHDSVNDRYASWMPEGVDGWNGITHFAFVSARSELVVAGPRLSDAEHRTRVVESALAAKGFAMQLDPGAMPGEGHTLLSLRSRAVVEPSPALADEVMGLAKEWSDLADARVLEDVEISTPDRDAGQSEPTLRAALEALAAYVRRDMDNNAPDWEPEDVPELVAAEVALRAPLVVDEPRLSLKEQIENLRVAISEEDSLQIRVALQDDLDEAYAALKEGWITPSNKFTVIGNDQCSGELVLEYVDAGSALYAFAVAAARKPEAEFSAAVAGHLKEDGGDITLPGERVVTAGTIMAQADVFGHAPVADDSGPDGP